MFLSKNVPVFTIRMHSAERSRAFYIDPVLLNAPTESLRANESTLTSERPSPPHRRLGIHEKSLDALRNWVSHRERTHVQGDIFERAGITSGSQQSAIKKYAVTQGWVKCHILAVGKGRACLWVAQPNLYSELGVPIPKMRGKGGELHAVLIEFARRWAEANGYSTDIERMLPNGKSVDLVLSKPDKTFYVEVACSPPLEKEVNNLIRNLESWVIPDAQIVAVLDKRSKERLETLIACESGLKEHTDRIKVILAGEFFKK